MSVYRVRRRLARRAFGLRVVRRLEVARHEREREVLRLVVAFRRAGLRLRLQPLLNAFDGPFWPFQMEGFALRMFRSTAL